MIGFLALYDPMRSLPDRPLDNLSQYLSKRGVHFNSIYRDQNVCLQASAHLGLGLTQANGSVLSVIGNVTPYNMTQLQPNTAGEEKSYGLRRVAKSYLEDKNFSASDIGGDHHFVLWDGARRQLVSGHDRLGCRPIFYERRETLLVAASSLRLILALGLAPPEIDDASVRRFVVGQALPSGRTYYQGISRLTPGATLICAGRGLEITPGEPIKPPSVSRRADAPADFREAFSISVGSRVTAPGDMVIMLSGGLDSSSITTIAALQSLAAGQPPVKTISMVFDGSPQWSERPFIEAVTQAVGCESTILDVDDYAPFESFDDALDEQGGLFLAPGLIMSRRMYARSAQMGARVVLDGHGGDEVVSHGWGRLHDLAQQQSWGVLARQVKGSAAITGDSPLSLFLLYFLRYGPLKPLSIAVVRFKRRLVRLLGFAAASDRRERLLPKAQLAALRLDPVDDEPGGVLPTWNTETRLHYATLTEPGQSAALEILNASAAAASIEPRYPFWDQGMIDLCLSLDAAEKLDRGWPRLIMRAAIPELSPRVRWRRDKLDFSPHLARGFVRHHSELMAEVFAGHSVGVAKFVDMTVARQAYRELLKKTEAASGEALQTVWRVMALALWLDSLESGGLAKLLKGRDA